MKTIILEESGLEEPGKLGYKETNFAVVSI